MTVKEIVKEEKLQEVSGKMNRDSRWQTWSNCYGAIYITV